MPDTAYWLTLLAAPVNSEPLGPVEVPPELDPSESLPEPDSASPDEVQEDEDEAESELEPSSSPSEEEEESRPESDPEPDVPVPDPELVEEASLPEEPRSRSKSKPEPEDPESSPELPVSVVAGGEFVGVLPPLSPLLLSLPPLPLPLSPKNRLIKYSMICIK